MTVVGLAIATSSFEGRTLSIEELVAQIKADEDSVRNNQQPEQRQIIRRSEIPTVQPKPAPEYGNVQSEAIAFSKRIPAYLYQHPKDSLADLIALEASKHGYSEAETERFLNIVTQELLANGVIKPSGEVMTPDHKPPMTAEEAKKRMIERFQIPEKANIIRFETDHTTPIYQAYIQWEIVTPVFLGIWEDGLKHWRYDSHAYSGSYDFLADRISAQSTIY
jgi:hypothetical protein